MPDLLTHLFSAGPFIPHGHCYLWKPNLVWLHLLSDGFIALAYYSIPLTLFYFVRKRQDLPFHWIFLLFAAFIVACGTTHLAEIWTLWYPTYWLSGSIKALTAFVSVTTAVQLIPLVPQALALPSPRQLEQANQELQQQIAQRIQVEEALRQAQALLEQRVAERTTELSHTNQQLQQEIQERRRTEAALRSSVEQLNLALAASKMGDWSWNITTDQVTLSPSATTIFGLPANQPFTWTEMRTLLDEADQERIQQVLNQVIEQQTDYDVEYRVRRADQGIRWIAAKGRAQYDSNHQVSGMLGVVQDITERKQAEVEREQLLERERLAREQAEAANRVKDEFLAVLSHELRTPLNPILGWVRLLQAGKLDAAKTATALDTIERNAKLQNQLIEDLLDISRILQGKLSLNFGLVDLTSTIAAAQEAVALAAEAKSIQITQQFPADPPPVLGDANRLQQATWNLLTNAVKFTPPHGAIKIHLEVAPPYARIIVQDTGKGIHPDFLPYVFEYFRQADSSTTRQFGGLGLGLAIVRQIVELHGGTVMAESAGEGLGATFIVQLPMAETIPAIASPELAPSDGLLDETVLQHQRILLVEDETDAREFVQYVLELHGATVTAVASGQEALRVFQHEPPDLLISDIGMPQMDGYDLLQKIRSSEAGSAEVPAIALTAYAGEINQQRALAAGFQLHLAKPLEARQLVQSILTLLRRKGELP